MTVEVVRSPIALPEGESGRYAVKYHTFTTDYPVVYISGREALLTGRKAVSLQLREPLRVHQLLEQRTVKLDGAKKDIEAVWMSDEPQELRQAAEWLAATDPDGRVLVGGLGLGVIATWLAKWPGVESVKVVERSRDVVKLVAPYQTGYTVVRDDLFSYLRKLKKWRYDYAYLDIWQGTGESEWWETVMPLRRIIANKFGGQNVSCWAEDIMLGQVMRALRDGHPAWHYEKITNGQPLSEDAATFFVTEVGLPEWERHYGKNLIGRK